MFGENLVLEICDKMLYQSVCSISKWTKSLEQINEIAWFFGCQYQFKKVKLWSIIFWGNGQK